MMGTADISVGQTRFPALPTVSVLVPTYRRPKDLERCLRALRDQIHPADQIVVVVRDVDLESQSLLERERTIAGSPFDVVCISVPGLVQAVNAGLQRVTSEVVSITDDDAMPHVDWLARIVRIFAERPQVGGVGGRDNVHVGDRLIVGERPIVGVIPKIGQMIGNHHLGAGAPRTVDMLKGVNASYRTDVILACGLDPRLRGTGAQVHWEVGVAYRIRAAGWMLWYDPQVLVEHYVAARHDEDQRNAFSAIAVRNAAYNLALLRMERLSRFDRVRHLAWCVAVGSRDAPGFLQTGRFLFAKPSIMPRKMVAGLLGTFEAFRDVSAARSNGR